MTFPQPGEAAPYYFRYIDLVPAGDVCRVLDAQLAEVRAALDAIPADRARHRYTADKWSIAEVIRHLSDTERLFAFRAFWFARGFAEPLPSFDQLTANAHAAADEQDWGTLVQEFVAVRRATLCLLQSLPGEAWDRSGIASGNPFTVRALAFLAAGHVMHHMTILRERYL